ncbi:MAG: hypothetical protein KOO65_05355 [Desulfobacterales bacterium]|nr:hypothetical protein [Desulfobacterales bacterium]
MKNNFKYHPVRYGFQLKSILNSIDQAWSDPRAARTGINEEDFREKLFTYFLKDAKFLYDPGVGLSEDDWISAKGDDFSFYDNYLFYGSNIFHLQPEIIELFKKTDVFDIDLDSVRLPFQEFYLYFGESAGFKAGEYGFMDGAYVLSPLMGQEKKFGLTVSLTYFLKPFDYSCLNSDFLKIDSQIQTRLVDENNEIEKSFNIKEVTNLILNALLFLSSKHNDTELSFDPDTPKPIVNKFNNAKTPRLKQRIENKAKSQGFSRVNFVGNSFKNFSVPGSGKSGASPSSHWRRGHWRNQAYGKSNSKHKLVWILPTLVNKDKGPVKTGRIYSVANITKEDLNER